MVGLELRVCYLSRLSQLLSSPSVYLLYKIIEIWSVGLYSRHHFQTAHLLPSRTASTCELQTSSRFLLTSFVAVNQGVCCNSLDSKFMYREGTSLGG